jgi:hypothetical protein
MTVAQTLGVVHGLVGNVRVVMEGTRRLHNLLIYFRPLVVLDGKASTDGIRQALGKCLTRNRCYLCSLGRSCPSPDARRNEQDETCFSFILPFVADTDGTL